MNFLPLVERELRVASRRRITYRIRYWAAILAMVLGFCGLLLGMLARGRGGAGHALFALLTGYTFGLCLLSGVFLTSGSLSEERREGTLGLLFLTDLKGYDVVLGKFLAVSLNAFYGLAAILPIAGLPLLMGGVTGGEFWRMALALWNAMFFSLALGTWISAISMDSQRAMGATFGLLLFFTAGLPILARASVLAQLASHWSWFTLVSPFYPFAYAVDSRYWGGRVNFWGALAASQVLGWAMLLLASYELPRRWRQGTGRQQIRSSLMRFMNGPGLRRSGNGFAERGPWLSRNPVMWLTGEEPAFRRLVWGLVVAWGVVVALGSYFSPQAPMWAYGSAHGFGFVLKMLVAIQACRLFASTRRTGELELLLCTPLRNGEILNGQWLALKHIFLRPLVLFLLFGLVPIAVFVWSSMAGPGWSGLGNAIAGMGAGGVMLVWFLLNFAADIVAIMFLGMWLALSMKKPALAPGLTILLVLVLPSIPFCPLALPLDFFFIVWGATKLQQDFRRLLSSEYQQAGGDLIMKPAAPAPGVPPVIPR